MAYDLSSQEYKNQRRGYEMTEYYFLRNELKNRNVYFPPEYRKYLEQRVEELRMKYEPDAVSQ